MNYLIVTIFTVLMAYFPSQAESEDISNMTKAGKLFTVTLLPGNKQMTVRVVGSKAVDIEWDKTGLQAYLIMGKKIKPLTVTKSKENFIINEEVPRPSELKLELSNQDKQESLNIPVH